MGSINTTCPTRRFNFPLDNITATHFYVTTVPVYIVRYADCKIHRDLKVALYREMISLFDKERGTLRYNIEQYSC
jgi:hypothetical protein